MLALLSKYLADRKVVRLSMGVILVVLGATPRARATPIDFETLPILTAQPNNFAVAGAMQTYTQAGLFTVSGGVVLGNPTFLASFAAHGSSPNTYGTADFADPSLQDTITFTFPGSANVTGLSGVLFNGQAIVENYVLTFFNPANVLLDTIPVLALAPDSSASGFFNFAFTPGVSIGKMTITTPNSTLNGWDFFIDNVNLQQQSPVVPEPSSIMLLGTGVFAVWYRRRRGR